MGLAIFHHYSEEGELTAEERRRAFKALQRLFSGVAPLTAEEMHRAIEEFPRASKELKRAMEERERKKDMKQLVAEMFARRLMRIMEEQFFIPRETIPTQEEEMPREMEEEQLFIPRETVSTQKDEKLRQEETMKKLMDEMLRLQDENSKMEARQQRQEETIKKLMDENWRTKQLEEYCLLYFWLFTDCHVSLETPTGTYISIHPPGTKGYHPNQPNVVQSLKEDVKRLEHPAETILLFGLNADAIDEWYRTIDEHYEQDYSMLETALRKGSNDFENYLAKYKPSKTISPYYIYAAAWDYSH